MVPAADSQGGSQQGIRMKTALIAATTAALFATPVSAQTFVSSQNATPTVLGAVIGGHDYTVTTTGISDLYDAFNSGLGLTFTADGVPTYAFPSPYTGFTPNGSNNDPTSGILCVGGSSLLCGALIGAFVPTVGASPSSYFLIGSSFSFTAASDGFLVGVVNDVGAYNDNGAEGFTATLKAVTPGTPGGVPEPAAWGMMIGGFGLAGGMLRRRSKMSVTIAHA